MTERSLMGALMIAFGCVLAGGAIFRWPWFREGRKYRRLEASLGPAAPRVLFGVVGAALIAFGTLNVLGLWQGGLDGRG